MPALPTEKPTLLSITLTVVGLLSLVVLCVAGIYAFQVFAYHLWVFLGGATVLTWLVKARRARLTQLAGHLPGRERFFLRARMLARRIVVVALTCWLALVGWAGLSPGGATPAPKAHPEMIRVLTWNILRGSDSGPPWQRFGWRVRKNALKSALERERPDILCVQEALLEQVAFIEGVLPGHRRIGTGRDDGHSAGEHCAVFVDRARFQTIDSGTFWLAEPANQPPGRWAFIPKRICTWVRLRDRQSGCTLRVYNAHLPLTESARLRAARLILARLSRGDPSDAVLLCADFNAPPNAPSRQLFTQAELFGSAAQIGDQAGAPTFHFYGIRLRSLDDILVDHTWEIKERRILDIKPDNTFPSDHFGILVDAVLRTPEAIGDAPK